MKKLIGVGLAGALLVILFVQVVSIQAKAANINIPITSPISITPTPPITSPISITPTPPCKPGFGFGDKNHCHSGPPGLFGKNFPFNFGKFDVFSFFGFQI